MKRKATLLAASDIGAAGTKIVDIDDIGQISSLYVAFSVDIVTVSVMLAPLAKTITKLELVDGGNVLASATGNTLNGVNFCEHGELPYQFLSLLVGATVSNVARLDFGRFQWDPEYALRPSMFKNLQLRITWDEDAANTGVIVNSFAVYADIDDAPKLGGAGGMFITKEVQNYAMAASANELIRIPVDKPIRSVYIAGDTIDHDAVDLFDNIKIDANNGGYTFYDQKALDLVRMLNEFPAVSLPVTLDDVVTAKDLYVPMAMDNRIAIESDATAHVTAQTNFALPAYKGQFIDIAASVDIQADFGTVPGRMPGGVIPFFLGDKNDPESWYRPALNDRLEATILSSSAADSGDTAYVLIQQVMSY